MLGFAQACYRNSKVSAFVQRRMDVLVLCNMRSIPFYSFVPGNSYAALTISFIASEASSCQSGRIHDFSHLWPIHIDVEVNLTTRLKSEKKLWYFIFLATTGSFTLLEWEMLLTVHLRYKNSEWPDGMTCLDVLVHRRCQRERDSEYVCACVMCSITSWTLEWHQLELPFKS